MEYTVYYDLMQNWDFKFKTPPAMSIQKQN
jgi:hypothetical protein